MFKKELLKSGILQRLYKALPWLPPIDDAPETVVQDFTLDEDVLENKLHGSKMFSAWTFGKGLDLVSCHIRLVDGRDSARVPTVLLAVNGVEGFNLIVLHKVHGGWLCNPYAYCTAGEKKGCIDILGEAAGMPSMLHEMFTAMFQAAINIMEREFKINTAAGQNPAFAAGNA